MCIIFLAWWQSRLLKGGRITLSTTTCPSICRLVLSALISQVRDRTVFDHGFVVLSNQTKLRTCHRESVCGSSYRIYRTKDLQSVLCVTNERTRHPLLEHAMAAACIEIQEQLTSLVPVQLRNSRCAQDSNLLLLERLLHSGVRIVWR